MLGATALLLHDRGAALAALGSPWPPASAAAMDFSLWLARRPPADLPHDRAAFLWWTGVDYRFRRRARLPAADACPWLYLCACTDAAVNL